MTKSFRPLVILTFCLALLVSLATTTLQQTQAATVPTTVDVVLHKLLFKDTLPTQQANNGTTKPDFSQADVPLNGVTFTVYDVTADFWQLVSKNGGAIEAAQTTLSQDSYQPASSSLIAQVVTAGQGEAYFGDLPLRQGQHAAVYLFKETAAPKNIEASQNLVVVMSSNLQHGNQSRIDLFPKNKMVSLMVLGFNGTRVQADTNDTTTQNVVLTKYGFEKDVTAIDRATDQIWTGDGAKPLQGVDFTIYNVTANYWASPKDYKGSFDSASVAATGTTNDEGQLTQALPTQSTDASGKTRAAVYLFHETNPRAGYNTSADFWLTLPAKAAADGNVYVYPKNVQKTTYERTFVKKDAETKEVLEGAGFKISNSDGKFLKLTDKDGQSVSIGEGFIDVLANNYRLTWVAESDATVFTSDKSGKFGLNGFADNTTTYTAVETNVPDGYDAAANTDFKADNSSSDILDAPSGILPHTGGTGTVIFAILGVALIAFGAVAYRKRRNGF